MFYIINDKKLFNVVWEQLIANQGVHYGDLELEPLETLGPNLLLKNELHLLFLDDNAGCYGKVTISHTNQPQNNTLFIPSNESALILKDIAYHVKEYSDIYKHPGRFEELTHKFYKGLIKNALWLCRKLSLNQIITISDAIDDPRDVSIWGELEFWGDFEFSTYWETPQGILGVILVDSLDKNQASKPESFAYTIQAISRSATAMAA